MPTIVDLPQKGVSLEFPDGMSDLDIESAILKEYPDIGPKEPNSVSTYTDRVQDSVLAMNNFMAHVFQPNAPEQRELPPAPTPALPKSKSDLLREKQRMLESGVNADRPDLTFSEQTAADVYRGVRNLEQVGYGIGTLGADLVGAEDAKEAAWRGYKRAGEAAALIPGAVGSFQNIEDIGSLSQYAMEKFSENLAMMLPSLVTGGVGAIAGKELGKRAATKLIDDLVAKGVARSVAEETAAKVLAKQVTLGSLAGAYPTAAGLEAGSIYGDVKEKTGKEAPWSALGLGMIAGALDVVPSALLLKRAAGPVVAEQIFERLAKRVGKAAAEQIISEAPTEAAQTAIERLGVQLQDPNQRVFSEEGINEIIDAFLAGGIAGAPMGVGGAAIEHARAQSALAKIAAADVENLQVFPAEAYDRAARLNLSPDRAQVSIQASPSNDLTPMTGAAMDAFARQVREFKPAPAGPEQAPQAAAPAAESVSPAMEGGATTPPSPPAISDATLIPEKTQPATDSETVTADQTFVQSEQKEDPAPQPVPAIEAPTPKTSAPDSPPAQVAPAAPQPTAQPAAPKPKTQDVPPIIVFDASNVKSAAKVETAKTPTAKLKAQKAFAIEAADIALEQASETATDWATPQLSEEWKRVDLAGAQPVKTGYTSSDLKAYEDAMLAWRTGVSKDLEDLFQKYGIGTQFPGTEPWVDIQGKEQRTHDPRAYSTEDRINLLKDAINDANRKQKPKIEIQVPGDGTFRIQNNKQAILDFKKRVEKQFPSAVPKAKEPTQTRTTAAPAPAVKLEFTIEDAVKASDLYQSTDTTRGIINYGFANGQEIVGTDGRRLIRILIPNEGTIDRPMLIKDGKWIPYDQDEHGKFPSYKQVIPVDTDFIGTIDAGELWQVLRGVKEMVTDKVNHFQLWKNDDGTFGVSHNNQEIGELSHNIKEGARYVGSYNVEYFSDALTAARKLGDEKVDIYTSDQKDPDVGPLVIRGGNHETILMPMRGGDALPPKGALVKMVKDPIRPDLDPTPVVQRVKHELKSKPVHGRLPSPLEVKESVPQSPEPAAKKKRGKSTEWRGEGRKRGRMNIFEAEDGDLSEFFDERFGQTGTSRSPGAFGRSGEFTFPSYEAFKKWMDERYAERDLDGMKLAFAEADTATKVRYCKDTRKAGEHLKAWVDHIATGAPLPKDDQPKPRTTPRPSPNPRPGPTGGSGPGPTPRPTSGTSGGARPGGPPPRPRPTPNAPHHRKFSITALTQLLRKFGKYPLMNSRLKRAYGRLVWGDVPARVELKSRLLWDTDLAERVLGHEIGHYIDLIVKLEGFDKTFAQRLKPLEEFAGKMAEAKDLRNDARNLSRDWRGPFLNGDSYRDSAKELMADFLSAMFKDPEWVNQTYPRLFDAFQQFRDGKPQFASAYREIETWLQSGTMPQELRAQHRKEVEETLKILQDKKPRKGATLWDRIKFGTFSMWQRAWQAEGKPREIGTSIAEELEYSRTWAAKENQLFYDDWLRSVVPLLEQINKEDPVQARTDLHSYSQARRTIAEVRASGQWIRQHPDEARQMLQAVLDTDESIKRKWQADLDSASDDKLYDLSAVIFREIHDRGETFANKIARKIDELNLGVRGQAALMAFNVRGKLLNPGGMTVETARELLRQMRDQLGAEKYAALEQAAANMRNLIYDVQKKMHEEGLISTAVWNELIAPNRGSYVPYSVLEYFDGYVRAGIMPQIGTAKEIADISVATQLKVAASNMWRQSQRQVKLLMDAYAKGGHSATVGEALKGAYELDKVRAQHLDDDTSRAIYYIDGKPHVVEFPGDRGKLIEKALNNPAFYEHMQWIVEGANMSHRLMQFYTQFHIPFLLWRNPVRGLRTAGLKTSFTKVMKQAMTAENYRLAVNYANAAFGGEMLPEIRDLVDRQVLLPPRLSGAMVRNMDNLRDLMENHAILAFQVRHFTENKPHWWSRSDLGHAALEGTEKLFTIYEALEKIYNYKAALERNLTPEQARGIARRGGIPNPGVGGKWSLMMEVFWPWTRVHIQGLRATYDMLRDPNLGKGFGMRFMLTEGLPRIRKVAVGMGVAWLTIPWWLSKDEDKDDPVMAEVFRRVSPYKMALDDIIPFGLYDPITGKLHKFTEFKRGSHIPDHLEVVSLRLPASEEGKLWGVLLYNMMISAPGAKDKLGRPGENMVNALSGWMLDYMMIKESPAIKLAGNVVDMALRGKNPIDDYRGQPAANQKLFDAGGIHRMKAIVGYLATQTGSVGEFGGWMLSSLGFLDEQALNSVSRRLPNSYKAFTEKVPFLRTAVSHDNYARYREEKITELEEKQVRARAILLMEPEARAMYDYYYSNIKHQDKLSKPELQRFYISKSFVEDKWGSLSDSDSFYSKAAHAVGKTGSSQARDTVRRDITRAASHEIAAFEQLKKTK